MFNIHNEFSMRNKMVGQTSPKLNGKYVKKPGKILAKNTDHLRQLINRELQIQGEFANLNHIDTWYIMDMSELFTGQKRGKFDGDISEWDFSNLHKAEAMFYRSKFTGKNSPGIKDWKFPLLRNTREMFSKSEFQGDCSNWYIPNVVNAQKMFMSTKIEFDITPLFTGDNFQKVKFINGFIAGVNYPHELELLKASKYNLYKELGHKFVPKSEDLKDLEK